MEGSEIRQGKHERGVVTFGREWNQAGRARESFVTCGRSKNQAGKARESASRRKGMESAEEHERCRHVRKGAQSGREEHGRGVVTFGRERNQAGKARERCRHVRKGVKSGRESTREVSSRSEGNGIKREEHERGFVTCGRKQNQAGKARERCRHVRKGVKSGRESMREVSSRLEGSEIRQGKHERGVITFGREWNQAGKSRDEVCSEPAP
ncbi:hypothetical protein [Lentibacillus sp. CBA3610]|uniref:hypothetical protein n=1 Tax=Lentibacillus sp. CBA3610 TaxID=2518176 RepID=UPI001595EF8A|nr:hypothetical protein [Lentibacillus sp. CBA3610]QKY68606.1 hypothetical protein Len3610_02305 [Lentibacillus sp. CBA3610]